MDSLFLTSLRMVFWTYLLLVLGQSILQRIYASRNTKSGRGQGPQPPPAGRWPSVDVLIPCYNENPVLLAACCASIAAQRYAGRITVWLIDDGSSNAAELEPTYRHFEQRHCWNVLRHPRNLGKRAAQDSGFMTGTGELVLTVDSDTVIDPDGVRRLVSAVHTGIGGATGNVGVWNASASWLTRLIQKRYHLLCEQERAAQSFHGAVLCCAGPFSLYRRTALKQVWPSYLEQRILGRRCTYGDDNHLTNLILAAGYRTAYEHQAKAFTDVPTSIGDFAQQQIRWNRTFYRELLWTVPNLWRRRRIYLAWDVAARLLLPLLLIMASAICAGEALLGGQIALYQFVGRLAAMAAVHSAFVIFQTRDPAFLAYGALYTLLLLPVRVHALATLLDHSWMTRKARGQRPQLVEDSP
jgi:N-acetylglucosaminyltransferase